MLTILKTSDRPCFLCGKADDTVEVKMKDKTFAGVICFDHLKQVLKRNNNADSSRGSKAAEHK